MLELAHGVGRIYDSPIPISYYRPRRCRRDGRRLDGPAGLDASLPGGRSLCASHRAAVKSHVALTILMSLFTITTLWLLSLPIVTGGG